MAKKPKKREPVEGDPKRGDAILKRMLQSKPKTHDEMVEERQKVDRGKNEKTTGIKTKKPAK